MTTNPHYRMATGVSDRPSRPLSALIYILGGGLVLVASLTLVMSVPDIQNSLAWVYLIQTSAYIALHLSRHQFVLIRALRPSMISLMYIGLNCIIGAWAFNSGNVVKMLGAHNYNYWPNIQQVCIVLSLCLFSMYGVSLRNIDLPLRDVPRDNQANGNKATLALSVAFLFIVLVASTKLTFGVLSQGKTVISAVLFYIIFRHNVRYKWVLAALVVGVLAGSSSQSKREAIFAIPAICLIALSYNPLSKVSWQKIMIGSIAIPVVAVLVVAMSIIRGYGDFNASGVVDAAFYIPQYLDMQNSIGLIMNNFELSYIFLHLHNSMSVALQAGSELAWGETYIRALLIWPIGDVLGYKPNSIIDQYTGTLFPAFRAEGGSFGITSIGEAAWNFGALAPMPVILIYLGLDTIFVWLVRLIRSQSAWATIFALNSFQFILYYTRGSGLDILLIYMLFSAGGGLLFSIVLKMLDLDRGSGGFGLGRARLRLDISS